ncbi:MAG: arsenate reductase ArsC [Gammaproteobacteria bacterium]
MARNTRDTTARSERAINVLVLCTGNSARSILAEALINHHGGGRFRAHSAGSKPAGQVNPLALRVLEEMRVPTTGLRSKSWDEFAGDGAPRMDMVITVCDNAAGEICPLWPGTPARAHWGLADPATVTGSEADKLAAFRETARLIEVRARRLVVMRDPLHENRQLESELRRIHLEAH